MAIALATFLVLSSVLSVQNLRSLGNLRFAVAAGMIVTFGGKPMVDSLGRMVNTAGRKRRGSRTAD